MSTSLLTLTPTFEGSMASLYLRLNTHVYTSILRKNYVVKIHTLHLDQ